MTVAIWLLCEPPGLQRQIDDIARRLDHASFAAHVTIAGGLDDTRAAVQGLAHIAAGRGPLSLRVQTVAQSEDPFMALYLRIAPEPVLADLGMAAGGNRWRPPHVSLAYGRIRPAERQALARSVHVPTRVTGTGLAVVEAGPGGWLDPAGFGTLARIPFGP